MNKYPKEWAACPVCKWISSPDGFENHINSKCKGQGKTILVREVAANDDD